MRLLPALACLAGLLVLAAPASAGSARTVAVGGTVASPATLDALLEQAATVPLADALARLQPAVRIAWLKGAVQTGGSSVLVVPLVRTLVRQARLRAEEEETEAADGLLAEALGYGLYGYIAMRVQAPLCSDLTSPDEYLHELGEVLSPLLDHLAGLDAASRRRITGEALALDDRIRPLVRRDTLICRRGLFADRFCPPGAPKESCPERAAPWAEFVSGDDMLGPRLKARKRARDEVLALGR
jgi:hypothetical protein